jgi:response regulator of citrate/malate metabolism
MNQLQQPLRSDFQLMDALVEMEHPYMEGVNNYLIKPFNSKTLKEKLEEILSYKAKHGSSAMKTGTVLNN